MSEFEALLGGILQVANIILADGEACERWMDELNCKSVPELFCSSCLDRAPVLQLGADLLTTDRRAENPSQEGYRENCHL